MNGDQENEELISLGEGGLYNQVDASSEGGPDERGGRSIQHTMSGTMTMEGHDLPLLEIVGSVRGIAGQ